MITYEYQFFLENFFILGALSVIPSIIIGGLVSHFFEEELPLFILVTFNVIIAIASLTSIKKVYTFDRTNHSIVTEMMTENEGVSYRSCKDTHIIDSNIIYEKGQEYVIIKNFTYKFNYEK